MLFTAVHTFLFFWLAVIILTLCVISHEGRQLEKTFHDGLALHDDSTLHEVALHDTALHHVALHNAALHDSSLYDIALQRLYCMMLHRMTLHCMTVHCMTAHCITAHLLHHSALGMTVH